MLKWAFAGFLFFVGIILAIVVYRTGYFKEVSISSAHKGPYTLIYQEHFGSYHKIPPVILNVEKQMKELRQPCKMAFGRYLDDPNKVDHDRLRSHGGCAFQPSANLEQIPLPKGLQKESLPSKEYILATFAGSPSVGPFRVYPKVMDWMEKYGYKIDGPVIELYKTLPDNTVFTTFLFPYK